MIVDPKTSFYTRCGITVIVEYSDSFFAKNIYVSEYDEQEITLDSLYNLAKEIALDDKSLMGIITVLVEYPLQGTVYRYGNHGPYWEEIGSLIGYA